MWIFEAQFKLKPEADPAEMVKLFQQLAVPIYRKIPGCISANIFKYTTDFNIPSQWDYVFVDVWESKEANEKAVSDGYIGLESNSELAKTGFYQKLGAMAEKSSMQFAELIASSEDK
jgi:quinol monooxygenase YgiN